MNNRTLNTLLGNSISKIYRANGKKDIVRKTISTNLILLGAIHFHNPPPFTFLATFDCLSLPLNSAHKLETQATAIEIALVNKGTITIK